MYTLRFWFEHGGGCLWGADEATKAHYGYKIRPSQLPLSAELQERLAALEARYATYLDWNNPAAGSLWSAGETAAFLQEAAAAYDALCEELGAEYTVKNELSVSCG